MQLYEGQGWLLVASMPKLVAVFPGLHVWLAAASGVEVGNSKVTTCSLVWFKG